ncbi:nuclear autoantigen Sp-100-like isoform X2 [Nycticebus coucang]|uniref:nuclear autoantigen Sp-100-like isoform X2 n=1 Tax=Nycticebus coucang TaxID=9470 RepID=UPI00234DFB4A|nr:nuclear autoantigen Sp-100-like isoform X2 [Nycticebus coucang]
MAGGDHDLSTRMSTEDQNIVDRLIWDRIFDHFKQHKVDISYAIKKTFPFLERLHDRKLITDKLFKDSQDSCENLVPVQRVVYNVLSELEKTFNTEVFSELFSDLHMKEYPDLIPICESFRNAVLEDSYLQETDEEKRVKGPSGQLSLEQGTGENSIPSLPQPPSDASVSTGTTPPENGLSEQFWETEQVKRRRKDETRDKNDALGCQEANQQRAQEPEPADIKKEEPFVMSEEEQQAQARTNYNQASEIIVIHDEDSEEFNVGGEALGTFTSALKNESVNNTNDLFKTNKGKEALKATCSPPQIVPGGGGARSQSKEISLAATHGEIGKRGFQPPLAGVFCPGTSLQWHSKTAGDSRSQQAGQEQQNTGTKGINTANPGCLQRKRRKRRVGRFPRDKNTNFQLSELPVTCGNLKGTLHKEKLKQGSSVKCIKRDTGRWFTPQRFAIKGGYRRSGNWKQNIRCSGYPLKYLIQNGYLQVPPRKGKMVAEPCNPSSSLVAHPCNPSTLGV